MALPQRLLRFFLQVYAQEFIRMAYQGILQREPDAPGLAAYSRELQTTADLAGILKNITNSDEHWRQLLTAHAADLTTAFLTGLIDQVPDKAKARVFLPAASENFDVTAMAREIAQSDALWEQLLQERAAELVGAAYEALLGRAPDKKGLAAHQKHLHSIKAFTKFLQSLIQSEEFNQVHRQTKKWPHPEHSYTKKTIVFIHVQKTGGTSLQNMLVDAYGHKAVFREHADRLYQYSPSELSRYSVFQGHFNFDSLAYIPRQHLSLCTFLRDPKKRLYSLYHFWRAHEPNAPAFHRDMARANTLPIVPFFKDQEQLYAPTTWNHMTWAIMGARQWKAWQQALQNTNTENEADALISSTMAPAIRRRVQDFVFIGLQERYDASVHRLFHILGKEVLREIKTDHSLEKLTQTSPYFKKNMAKQTMTAELDALLDRLVQLDTIVYQEAARVFHSETNKSV